MSEDDLAILSQVIVNVFDPARLLLHDILGSRKVLHLPFIDELTDKADLSGHTWDSKFGESPIVLITANGDAHDLLAGTLHRSLRERSILRNLREYLQDAGSSLLDVILLSTVKWINESVAI